MLFRTTLIATLLTATALAAPVTFKDFGVIWICGNQMDYTVWAEAGSGEVMLSQDKPKKKMIRFAMTKVQIAIFPKMERQLCSSRVKTWKR